MEDKHHDWKNQLTMTRFSTLAPTYDALFDFAWRRDDGNVMICKGYCVGTSIIISNTGCASGGILPQAQTQVQYGFRFWSHPIRTNASHMPNRSLILQQIPVEYLCRMNFA